MPYDVRIDKIEGGYAVMYHRRHVWKYGESRWVNVGVFQNLAEAITEARWYATDDRIDIFQEDWSAW